MSDPHLTTYAQMRSDHRTKKLIEKLKDPELTAKGKRELLFQAIFNSFLDGHDLAIETGTMMTVDPRFDD